MIFLRDSFIIDKGIVVKPINADAGENDKW